MVFRLFFLVFILSACASLNDKETEFQSNSIGTINVQLRSMIHHPYCGGAYPSPEQEQGYLTVSPFKAYYISIDSALNSMSSDDLYEISDDSVFKINLLPGTYFVFNLDKKLSLKEYMEKFGSTNENEDMSDSSCYLKWKNTPDYKFIAANDTTYQITYRAACFTGINPCITYTGPYPP